MLCPGTDSGQMGDVLSESEMYVYSKRFLRRTGWRLVGGEPPGGSDGLPRVEAKHPEKTAKGSRGSKKVDMIAYRDGWLLLLELKSTFERGDVDKLDELTGESSWRASLLRACEERNALQRAGVQDPDLPSRILDGTALVKGIGLGKPHTVPDDYLLMVLKSHDDIAVTLGADSPLDRGHFEVETE